MFDNEFTAIVSAPRGKTKNKKNQSVRRIEFSIKADFDDLIAAGLDEDARAALDGLRSRALSEAKIPIDGVAAIIILKNGKDRVDIKDASGVCIKGKANMNKEEDSPTAEIVWAIPYEEKAWAFLGRNFSHQCEVTISNSQLSLVPRTNGKTAAASKSASKTPAAGKTGAKNKGGPTSNTGKGRQTTPPN